jgi:O-methyltransferase involved in polyketide biosynthesis
VVHQGTDRLDEDRSGYWFAEASTNCAGSPIGSAPRHGQHGVHPYYSDSVTPMSPKPPPSFVMPDWMDWRHLKVFQRRQGSQSLATRLAEDTGAARHLSIPSRTATVMALARRDFDPYGWQMAALAQPNGIDLILDLAHALEHTAQALDVSVEGNRRRIPPVTAPSLSPEQLKAYRAIVKKLSMLLHHIATPNFAALYAGRLLFVDQQIDAFAHVTGNPGVTVVLSGAGWDSKALRWHQPGQHYPFTHLKPLRAHLIELDLALSSVAKRRVVEMMAKQQHLSRVPTDFVAVDFENDTQVTKALRHASQIHGKPHPVFLTMEGLSYYLTKKAVRHAFENYLKVLPTGSRVFVDWYQKEDWQQHSGQGYAQFLATLNERVKFTPRDFYAEVLANLTIPTRCGYKYFVPVVTRKRGEVARELLEVLHPETPRVERRQPKLAEDGFGNMSRFTVVEIAEFAKPRP